MSNLYTKEQLHLNHRVESFGERLEFLINNSGISKLWLAEKLGISKQAFNWMLKHSVKPKYVDELAEILQANPAWIEFGIGSYIPEYIQNRKTDLHAIKVNNSTSINAICKGEAYTGNLESIEYTNNNIEKIIAYKIQNDSAFPPFIEGTIMLFEKEKKPENGDFVLLFSKENDSALVRQYLTKGSDVYFLSKNNLYKTLVNIDAIIIGTLIEARYIL